MAWLIKRSWIKFKQIIRTQLRLLLKSRNTRVGAAVTFLLYIIYFAVSTYYDKINKTEERYIEDSVNEAFSQGDLYCEIPKLDPFDPEITQFDVMTLPNITCQGFDWVRCHLSCCQVRKEITDKYTKIVCKYRDIVHTNDTYYELGPASRVLGNDVYKLNISDHVKVTCTGKRSNDIFFTKWSGHAIGFRPITSPPADHDALNVLMIGFDSTSQSSFIRQMPRSYEMLIAELGAVVLNGYNIVGRGTSAAMFPLLFGMQNCEDDLVREIEKINPKNGTLDTLPNLFSILKLHGYRTQYFEDSPWINTFKSWFNGFAKQPADHYVQSFFQEESNHGMRWLGGVEQKYCVGDVPRYLLMINKTKEFFEQDGKKFAFTFIVDISHDDHNMIGAADDNFAEFLGWIKYSGLLENTLVIVFGDHGPSFSEARRTFLGKLEERLPLMSIVLPRKLKRERPSMFASLVQNVGVLTTPFDVHSTILDAVGLRSFWNPYKVWGARIPRGLSLLNKIPRNRTCREAEVGPHWCSCVHWESISDKDPLYRRAAEALLTSINELITPHRQLCMFRSLNSIQYVMRRRANKVLMSLERRFNPNGYGYKDKIKHAEIFSELMTVKVTMAPGEAVYEANLVYQKQTDSFQVDWHAVQRTNAYGHEPDCISDMDPVLNPFCYCIKYQSIHT